MAADATILDNVTEDSSEMKLDKTFMVSVNLYGDNLDPDTTSALVGAQPTMARRKGEKRVIARTGQSYTQNTGVWELLASTESAALPDHIDEIMLAFRAFPQPLSSIAGVERAHVDVHVAELEHDQEFAYIDFELTPENISDLSRLGLPVRFSIRAFEDQEQGPA